MRQVADMAPGQTLCANHNTYQDLFDTLPLGVVFHDAQGHVISANPAALDILGVSLEEIQGKPPADPCWQAIQENGCPFPADRYPVMVSLRTGQVVKHQVVGLFNRVERRHRWLNVNTVPVLKDGRLDKVYAYFEDMTQRKDAEQTRRESEYRLRQLIEHAPTALVMLDRDMRYLLVSQRWRRDYPPGRGVPDMLGRSHYEVYPEIPERWKAIHRRCLAGAVESCEEDPFPRQDGSIDWIKWAIRPWFDTRGAVGGLIIISERVNERRQVQQALRESEARYRSLVDSAPNAIFINEGNQLSLVNPACVTLFGARNASELLAKPLFELVHPDFHDLIQGRRERALRLGQPNPLVELKMIRLDGEVIDVEASSAPFDSGGIRALHVVLRDIGERKRRRAELARLQRVQQAIDQCNRALQTAVHEADYLQNVCHIVREHCGHATVWIGLAEQDPARSIRRVAWAGLAPPDMDRLLLTWADTEWGQGPTGTAIRTGQPDVCRIGEPRAAPWEALIRAWGYASAAALPLLDMDGRPLGALALYSADVQAFMPDEVKVLGVLANDLTLGIRTLRLRAAHAQTEANMRVLRQQMQQLLEWQVAGQTAAGIAHELNQPLNAITTFGEAARRLLANLRDPPYSLIKAVTGMTSQAERAGRVLRELLAFLRRADSTRESFDLNSLAQEALTLAQTDGYAAEVTLELAPGLRPVLGNRLQIEKVLLNLLRNSIEAGQEQSPGRVCSIRASLSAVGERAQVTLTDTGPGLDATAAPRIFEPFFTTKPKGIGMGLTISRALVEAHGGQLWYTPTPGGGASFHFTLPFAS